MKTIDVVLGMQWGDEGKGKIVDALTPRYDVVARFQGGPNAGHSIHFGDRSFVLHTVPSGIFRKGTQNIIGNGVVIDPLILMEEIHAIEQMGVDVRSSLRIAKRAHLILPTHRLLDAAQERGKGANKVGTTGKGIGPAYTDKVARIGLRVGDLLLPDFHERYQTLRDQHLRLLGMDRIDDQAWLEAADELRRFTIIDNEVEMNRLIETDHTVLAEGAQGSLLDVDFGTYPFVTSSSTLCAGACIGLGVAPSRIGRVYGIFKAYCTRVGAGPFPTELNDETGEKLRQIGHEFGATTGRPRRTGWLDLVALRYAVRMNGTTSLIMMKSDVLNDLPVIRVCVGYRMGNKQVDYFPFEAAGEPIEPVYKDFEGWQTDISQCRTYDSLPSQLKDYIAFIERETGVPVDIVSVGPDRDATIYRQEHD
ncbi:MAG: adenylosuccinate synthase [Paludibacteraceae bacterium]|nr:adenylosuccinate synthase [Paludibacteraceae bacterium]